MYFKRQTAFFQDLSFERLKFSISPLDCLYQMVTTWYWLLAGYLIPFFVSSVKRSCEDFHQLARGHRGMAVRLVKVHTLTHSGHRRAHSNWAHSLRLISHHSTWAAASRTAPTYFNTTQTHFYITHHTIGRRGKWELVCL